MDEKTKKKIMGVALAVIMFASIFTYAIAAMIGSDNDTTINETVTNVDDVNNTINYDDFIKMDSVYAMRSAFINGTLNNLTSDYKLLNIIVTYNNSTFMVSDSNYDTNVYMLFNDELDVNTTNVYLVDIQDDSTTNTTYFTWLIDTGNETFVENHFDLNYTEDMMLNFF